MRREHFIVHPIELVSAAALALLLLLSGTARAEAPSKEACLEAHGQGQDLREAGKLSLARAQFVKCGQSSCPGPVQADCARFGDELQQMTPTVTFAARDGEGHDVPGASVYVDDVLVASRIDGKSHEIDPGSHRIRFVHA